MPAHHKEAEKFLKKYAVKKYPTGIILGTGLGGLVKEIKTEYEIEYSDIPGFPVSTVETHKGRLIFGTISGKEIVAMQGRFHYYEGYSHERVTFPVHILKELGVKHLLVSNACGAINPEFRKTDLMIITSHINLHFSSPLINFNYKGLSPPGIYSRRLIKLAEDTALENKIPVQKGVYASVHGPNLETPAEYRAIRRMGADTVGMSTIPEVLIANKLGIESLGLSIITDEGFPDTLKVAELKHIVEAAGIAEPKLTKLTIKLIEKL